VTAIPRGVGDVGYVVRALARHPAFAGAVIATLGVAIGANVAVFAIVNALVFRPFPYPRVDRLVSVFSTPRIAVERLGVSLPDYADWRDRARSFDAIGLGGGRSFVMSGAGPADVVDGARSTASLFRVIGLAPLIGRVFTEDEDRPGGAPVVVLGQTLWERTFAGDPGVLGRVLRLDGRDCMVIGVMPRDFAFPDHAQLWVPMAADPTREDRAARGYSVMARLRPGVTVDAAGAELHRIAAEQARDHPATNGDVDVLATSLAGVRGSRGIVFALSVALGAGGFVLLIACANVANLLLARTASRARELAIRAALGATRWQVARLLLIEGLVLMLPGAALGLLVGQAGRDALIAMVPSGVPTWMRFDTDWRVLVFTLSLSVVAAAATTLSTGVRAARRRGADVLKEWGGGSQVHSARVRSVLVVSQVALTFILLVCAGLMLRTFFNATRLDAGFRPAGLLTLRLPLPAATYPPERRAAFYDTLAAKVASLPGIVGVGVASAMPLADEVRGVEYDAEGEGVAGSTRQLGARSVVSETYFRTLGVPIVAGRAFDRADGAATPEVTIVSQAIAERLRPRGEAVGKRLRFPVAGSEAPWLTVVGVAGDIRSWRIESSALPTI